VPGGISKWRWHRVAGLPNLHLAVIDGEAQTVHVGARISREDVRAMILQIAFRIGFDVRKDDRHSETDDFEETISWCRLSLSEDGTEQ
jgi:hypothetical protein